MINKLQWSNVSHLVWAALGAFDQDPHHLSVVVLGSLVYWKSTVNLRQEWVGLCL